MLEVPKVRCLGWGEVTAFLKMPNRQWQDKQSNQWKDETTFVDVTLWGRTAEVAGEHLSKGKQVLIEGRLQLDTFDDLESGQNRSKLRVVGEQMTMLGSASGGNSCSEGARQESGEQPQSEKTTIADDIPF